MSSQLNQAAIDCSFGNKFGSPNYFNCLTTYRLHCDDPCGIMRYLPMLQYRVGPTDECVTTRTGRSTVKGEASSCQRTCHRLCVLTSCTPLPRWRATVWRPSSGTTKILPGGKECKDLCRIPDIISSKERYWPITSTYTGPVFAQIRNAV